MENPSILGYRPPYANYELSHNHCMTRENPVKRTSQRFIFPRFARPPSGQHVPRVVHGARDLHQVNVLEILVYPNPIRHPKGVFIELTATRPDLTHLRLPPPSNGLAPRAEPALQYADNAIVGQGAGTMDPRIPAA